MKPAGILRVTRAQAMESVLRLAEQPIYEGLLNVEETEVLPILIDAGIVRRCWRGVGGFLGLAEIERVKP